VTTQSLKWLPTEWMTRIKLMMGTVNFSLHTTSRLTPGSTHPPTNWVLWVLSCSWGGWRMKLTTYLHLLPRPTMCRGLLPHLLYNFMAWHFSEEIFHMYSKAAPVLHHSMQEYKVDPIFLTSALDITETFSITL
jgi:hypothetical protein